MAKGINAEVIIDYTNWKGERRNRRIIPHYPIYTRLPPYYPDRQWLLFALDVEKGEMRHFSFQRIHSWTETASAQDAAI